LLKNPKILQILQGKLLQPKATQNKQNYPWLTDWKQKFGLILPTITILVVILTKTVTIK